MKPLTVLGIYREKRFSPGKVEADAAILDATLAELAQNGWSTKTLPGEAISTADAKPELVVSMAQSPQVLRTLDKWSQEGIRVVNSAQSIRNCYRKPQLRLLQEAQLPLPISRIVTLHTSQAQHLPTSGRYWLKRGDVHAMQTQDVVCVTSKGERQKALEYFDRQGVTDILVQQHVEGSVVKFYGVVGNAFFRAFLGPSGEDVTCGLGALRDIAQQAAQATGLEVYGGDAIITPHNRVVLIDLNDWPSFSKCYQPAAKSIANHLLNKGNGEGFRFASNCTCVEHTPERIADFKTT